MEAVKLVRLAHWGLTEEGRVSTVLKKRRLLQDIKALKVVRFAHWAVTGAGRVCT